MSWTYVINDLNAEKIIEAFYQNKFQKTNQKDFRIEKVTKRKRDKLYVKWKGYDNSFNSWIDKKDRVYMSEYFPEPKSLGGKVIVELDLSNYTTKTDFKNAAGIDTFAKKVDWANLKSNLDKVKNVPTSFKNLKSKSNKIDVDKLVPIPVDLNNLSDVVKMMLLNKIYIFLC